MTTETPELTAVLQRLERVERPNKRLAIVGLTALVVFSVILILTQVSWITGVVETNMIRVKDSDGMTRLVLGSSPTDGAGLSVMDAAGRPRAILAVSGGGPRLEFRDSAGNTTYQVP